MSRRNPSPQFRPRRREGEPDTRRQNSPSLLRGRDWGEGFAATVILTLLLTTACTARVTGHTSPIAHDYGPVEWHALQQTVVQPFVYGPGHQAAIANDGKTTPEQFQERLAALPEDTRDGTLLELAVGLRLAGESEVEQVGKWDTGARLQVVRDADNAPLVDEPVDSLPRDGDWLKLDVPISLTPGTIVSVRIIPGDGPDADRLHFGITPGRAPYGGWMATDDGGHSAGGALLIQTVYERDVDARSLVTDGLDSLRDAVRDDIAFSGLWLLLVIGVLASAGWLWRLRPAREG